MRRIASVGAVLALVFGVMAITPGKATAAYLGPWSEYNGHFYNQVNDIDWDTAEQYAVNHGGHLVTINDQAEQDWLASTFTDPNLSIGFNDKADEGIWVWASGEDPGYTNWAPGEPNDYGDGEDIAVMNWEGQNLWNDLNENFSAIIEVPAPYAGNDAWDEPNFVDETYDDYPDMAVAGFQDNEPLPCASGVAEGSVWYWFWNPALSDIRIEIDGDDGDATAALYGPFETWPSSLDEFAGMTYPAEQGPCTWDTGPGFRLDGRDHAGHLLHPADLEPRPLGRGAVHPRPAQLGLLLGERGDHRPHLGDGGSRGEHPFRGDRPVRAAGGKSRSGWRLPGRALRLDQ